MSIKDKIKNTFQNINFGAIITVGGVAVGAFLVYQYLKRKLPEDRLDSYPAAFELPPPPKPEKVRKTKEKTPRTTKRGKVYSPELSLPNPMNPTGLPGVSKFPRLRGYDGSLSGLAEMACGDDPNCTCGLADFDR